MLDSKKLYQELPETSGVYLMRGNKGSILYIGKAGNLKRRVSSYFLRPLESRLQKMVSEIRKIDFKLTDTSLEALILESQLIKKYRPPFNVREKDDKSFWFVEITDDEFPRIVLVRGKDIKDEKKHGRIFERYGPFVEAGSLKEAMKLIRKIFPYNTHTKDEIEKFATTKIRPCFNWQIGLCPGVCAGAITIDEYKKVIRNIKLIFEGKKQHLIDVLESEMQEAATLEEFELAEKKKRQLFALRHINDIALIRESEDNNFLGGSSSSLRIEGYDISNISGTSAVGSMVVFTNNKPARSEYKKFKIKTITGANDVGMLKEVLRRRLNHFEWSFPNLFLVDGGKPQVNAVKDVFAEFAIEIPIVGIVKGKERKRNDFIGVVPDGIDKNILIKVRDEAHRFAISYHRKLRGKIS